MKMSGKLRKARRNSPEEVAAVEHVIRILSNDLMSLQRFPSRCLSKEDLHLKTSLGIKKNSNHWEMDGHSFWIENIFHFALNVTETENHYRGSTTKVRARITYNEEGDPCRLIITSVSALVQKEEDWPVERVVFKLKKTGPTFSTECPALLRKYTCSPIIVRLMVDLKKVLASSQIKVKVTNKEPREPSNKKNRNKKPRAIAMCTEDLLHEKADDFFQPGESASEDDAEEFLSSDALKVITIGNNDDEVETAEQLLSVDNADVSQVAKQNKCILL